LLDSRGERLPIHHILIAVKDGESDEDALALGYATARKSHAHCTVMHVIEVPQAYPLTADLPAEVEHGERALQHAEQVAARYDLELETELVQARKIGPAIVDEAVARNSDLVIVTAQLHRRPGEFAMGKTVPYVLSHAPCRVWICRSAINEQDRNPFAHTTHHEEKN